MEIVTRRYNEWLRNIRRRMWYATYEDGQMRLSLRAKPDSMTYAAFAKNGQLMGWLLIWPVRNEIFVDVFVNLRYRRMGVATALIRKALEDHDRITLFTWDSATRKLFPLLKKRYPDRIKVRDWHRFRARYGGQVKYAG